MFLFGTATVQVHAYFKNFPGDGRLVKCLVSAIVALAIVIAVPRLRLMEELTRFLSCSFFFFLIRWAVGV